MLALLHCTFFQKEQMQQIADDSYPTCCNLQFFNLVSQLKVRLTHVILSKTSGGGKKLRRFL